MKQLFQLIPQGSSNIMLQDKELENKMRKQCLETLLTMILVVSIGLVGVNADISVSDPYVTPGNNVDLIFTGSPGSEFLVTVLDSRGIMDNASLVFDDSGQYVWNYLVNGTAYTDAIKVTAIIDGVTIESGFIVSSMHQRHLAETIRIMAINSKKQAESALIEAKRAGKLPPDMVSAYREAVQLLGDSKSYIEQEEHSMALETIKSALTLFEMIVENIYSENVTPSETPSNSIQALETLKTLTTRLEEIKRTARNLERLDYNADMLNYWIAQMNSGLEKAQFQIESNNIDEATRQLSAVNQNLKMVQNSINQRIQEYNRRKASSYQTSLMNRYNTMRNTLTFMQTANTDKVSSVLNAINTLESKLDEARTLYEIGDIDGNIKVLQVTNRDFKETFSGLNGEETRKLLDTLDTLTVQLEKEVSPTNRQKIQMQIQTIKNSLSRSLESETAVAIQPSRTPSTNSPSRSQKISP